jgi:hypothetical protein
MYSRKQLDNSGHISVGLKKEVAVRQTPVVHPVKIDALGSVKDQSLKVSTVRKQATLKAQSLSPAAPNQNFTIGGNLDKGPRPVILPRLVTDKLREAPTRKVSLDINLDAGQIPADVQRQQQPLGSRAAGELLRTPSGLPDLIPEPRPPVTIRVAEEQSADNGGNRVTLNAVTANKEAAIVMRPTDILRTPYLVEPPKSEASPVALCRPLTAEVAPRFPQIPNNSIVAKETMKERLHFKICIHNAFDLTIQYCPHQICKISNCFFKLQYVVGCISCLSISFRNVTHLLGTVPRQTNS